MSPELDATATASAPPAWGIGLAGRVVVTFAVTGGLLFGGFWLAWLTLTGRVGEGDLILASTERFLLGAALGWLHGWALGYHGRNQGISKRWAVWAELRATIFSLPALAVAWPVSGWIGSTASTREAGGAGPMALTIVAWLAGLAVVAYTVAVAGRAIRLAYFRWPNRRSGTSLVAGVLLATIIVAFDVRPDLWGTRLRLTEVTLAILALMTTAWISGPIITLALRFSRGTVLRPRLGFGPTPAMVTVNFLLGSILGVTLAVLGRGFHQVPYLLPTITTGRTFEAALLATFSHATLDEILLRFVPITLMACLLARGRPRRTLAIGVVSVAFSILVQVALYAPGVTAIGFRSSTVAWTYLASMVALPAAVFGVLLWWRSLGTAWLAHVSWLLAAAWMSTGG